MTYYKDLKDVTRLHSYIFIIVILFTIDQSQSEESTATIKFLKLGEHGQIQSMHFPNQCCDEQTILLKVEPATSTSTVYIHLNFDDLDLPPGTSFKIFKNEDDEPSSLFREQAHFRYNNWIRPYITAATPNVIYIVLKPLPDPNINKGNFAGFRASYSVTRNPLPAYPLTSELCSQVPSAIVGLKVLVKPQPMTRYNNKWLDCIWLVRPPIQYGNNTNSGDVRTYIRFDMVDVSHRGKIEVRRGTHSAAPIIVSGSTLANISQPAEGFVGPQGFYIRAFMKADDRANKLSFTYGMINLLPEGNSTIQCPSDDFRCNAPYDNWCIPDGNHCNKVSNCPNGEDELSCVPTTTSTTTTTTTTTTTPAPTTTKKKKVPTATLR